MSKPPPRSEPDRLRLATCRLCHENVTTPGKGLPVRYSGGRHYAHALCWLLAGKSVQDLPASERGAFTPVIIKAFLREILRRRGLGHKP